jgi:glycyl-tRNA synthetase
MSEVKLEDIVSLAKRRGFIFPGSDVYGGLSGTWDYGPLGVALKKNIQNLWWKMFVEDRDDMYGVDAAILMNQKVWRASGHKDGFTDPAVNDLVTGKTYRADHLLKQNGVENVSTLSLEEMTVVIKEKGIKSPDGNTLGEVGQFNMMFRTNVGASALTVESEAYVALSASVKLWKNQENFTDFQLEKEDKFDSVTFFDKNMASFLRPETAQGIFTNFKNVVDTFYPDLPFGLAQQGKAFRNEISPRDFVFRSREFEQMEIEYFVNPSQWEEAFEQWRKDVWTFLEALGLPKDKIHELPVPDEDRAHYSKRTIDFEYDFPIGREELLGLAYRTDFDLMNIQNNANKSMEYRPKDGGEPFVPHVIGPSFGLERAIMAVLSAAYTEDEVNGEKRIFLKLPAHLAPVKVAVLPLAKNKPELVAKAREVYAMLKKEVGNVMWVDTGNIGKNYRKMDEIGVPYCVTIDFDTLEGEQKDTVTVRHRDTTEQRRVDIEELLSAIST